MDRLAIQSEVVQKHLCMPSVHHAPLSEKDIARIDALLKAQNAVLISHFYTHPSVQELTEKTGGKVADSLVMTQFGKAHAAKKLIVSGVRFMGETAKIFNPKKHVLVPDLQATCSLDLLCPEDGFANFIQEHPDREVVVYINTSADVKAHADWVVTSSIAEQLVEHLHSENKRILWAPDKYLGSYIAKKTQADIISWQGACVVHEEFKHQGLLHMRALHPEAAVLAHPESPQAILEQAHVVGSTSQLIAAAAKLPHKKLIVATDQGIFYKMQQAAPNKQLIIAPTAGVSAECKSCARCPWMALNSVQKIEALLTDEAVATACTVELDPVLVQAAQKPLYRMLDFAAST